MESRASVAKHPIHVLLVGIPIGLWVFSLVADLIHAADGGWFWADIAFFTMAGGLVGAVVAAVFGLIDYTGIESPQVKRIATIHMILSIVIVTLYLFNLLIRYEGGWQPLPIILSVTAIGMLGVSGWLGGTMVHVLGQSVAPVDERVTMPTRPPAEAVINPARIRT